MAQTKTLLLVFLHGFKGGDATFENFPTDLRALLAHTLPNITVLSVQYPKYDTRGDLKECVAKFKEWLQNKVIDLEVANHTPSPTVDPGVHVILCGHSMGGIVAAETLLSVARDEIVPHVHGGGLNETESVGSEPAKTLFFPHITAVLAFDTPYLGISPGVLAHGAEEHINQASSAYKAFGTASELFGWNSPRSASPQAVVPASTAKSGGAGWGKWAAVGGAAAAIAGAAGAAYLSRDQISQGFAWAGSHLEFVGVLARGADLQKRVESVVKLTESHNVGFANYYTALGTKVTSQTKYAGSMLGSDRTFCVVPRNSTAREGEGSQIGSKRDAPPGTPSGSGTPVGSSSRTASRSPAPPTTPTTSTSTSVPPPGSNEEAKQGEQVRQFAQDTSKSKGMWVKCVNEAAGNEVSAHTGMFSTKENSRYHAMLPAARDQIVEWVDREWYESARSGREEKLGHEEDVTVGAEDLDA